MKRLHQIAHPWLSACSVLLFCASAAGSLHAAEDGGWGWTKDAGWSRTDQRAKPTAEAQLRYAKKLEDRREYFEACQQYFLLLKTYPKSPEASVALQRLSVCLFESENYMQSFKAVQTCIARYPNSIHLEDLLRLEYRIGNRFLDGARVSLLGGGNTREKSLRAAVMVFLSVYANDQYGELADDALYQAGEALMELGDHEKARAQYYLLRRNFPESDLAPLARYKIEVANVHLGRSSVEEARERWEELETAYGDDPDAIPTPGDSRRELRASDAELDEREAQRMLKAARFYEQRGSPRAYDAALYSYRRILEQYPETDAAQASRDRLQTLEEGGRPQPGISDEEYDLPSLNGNGVTSTLSKLNPMRLFRRDHSDAAAPEPTPPQQVEAPPVEIPPLQARGRAFGDVVVDLDEEAAQLKALESGSLPPQRTSAGEDIRDSTAQSDDDMAMRNSSSEPSAQGARVDPLMGSNTPRKASDVVSAPGQSHEEARAKDAGQEEDSQITATHEAGRGRVVVDLGTAPSGGRSVAPGQPDAEQAPSGVATTKDPEPNDLSTQSPEPTESREQTHREPNTAPGEETTEGAGASGRPSPAESPSAPDSPQVDAGDGSVVIDLSQ
jgi:tetratricopeptide (TPR) repeat protein